MAKYTTEQRKRWRKAQLKKNPRHDKITCVKKYGLTIKEFDNMVMDQEGRCFVCNNQCDLFIDHDHKTGKVRKLLCASCNAALGMAHESIEILEKLKFYLIFYLGK